MMRNIYLSIIMVLCSGVFSHLTLYGQDDCLSLRMEQTTAATGDQLCLDITADNFTDMYGLQLSLNWDPGELSYVAVTDFELSGLSPGSFGDTPSNLSNGQLPIAWINQNGSTATVSDGDKLFSICFEVTANTGTSAGIYFSGAPTQMEFTGSNDSGSPVILNSYSLYHGQVLVDNGSIDFPVISSECPIAAGCMSDSTYINVTVTDGADGYSYVWSYEGSAIETTEDLNILSTSGHFDLVVTDQNGITTAATFVAESIQPEITAINVNDATCPDFNDGSILVNIAPSSGIYYYIWSHTDAINTNTVTGLTPGDYTFTALDWISGCVLTDTVTIGATTTSGLQVTADIQDDYCGSATGSIALTVTNAPGTVSYSWDNGATTADLTGLLAGVYTVTVSDGAGCEAIVPYTVGEQNAVNYDTETIMPGCNSSTGSITLTFGAGNYQVLGFGAQDFSVNAPGAYTVDGLNAGDYFLTITDTDNNCSSTETITLTEVSLLVSNSLTQYDTNYELAFAAWNGTPPLSLSWADGSSTGSSTEHFVSTGLIDYGNNYSYTLTDANGCVWVSNLIEVTEDTTTNNGPEKLLTPYGPVVVSNGDNVCYDFVATDFAAFNGMSLNIYYNHAVLDFTGVADIKVAGMTAANFSDNNQGLITLDFSTADMQDVQVAATDLFELCFEVIGQANMTSFTHLMSGSQITTAAGDTHTLGGNIYVQVIGAGGDDVELSIGSDVVDAGGSTCISVTAETFNDVNSMQFSVAWDSSLLTLNSATPQNLAAFNPLNLGTFSDRVTVAWFDPAIDGETLPAGTAFLELCFTSTGVIGTSPIVIDGSITAIEFTDASLNLLDFTINAGSITIPDDLVWPGDTDANGSANHYDLLNIGLGYTNDGIQRQQATINWEGQYVPAWGQATPESQIDYRYADSNGDGIINADDTLALIQNWGEVVDPLTSPDDPEYLPAGLSDLRSEGISLYVAPDTAEAGATLRLPIILGEADNHEDVYGVAFSLIYPADAVVPGSLLIDLSESWLGDTGADMISVTRNNAAIGKVDIAMVRTDGFNRDDYGAIAHLQITIEDVLFRVDNFEFNISILDPKVVTAAEVNVPVNVRTTTTLLTGAHETLPEGASVRLAPNPVQDQLQILATGVELERVELYDLHGRLLLTHLTNHPISMTQYAAGQYQLRVITNGGTVWRKVIKQ